METSHTSIRRLLAWIVEFAVSFAFGIGWGVSSGMETVKGQKVQRVGMNDGGLN